MANEPQPATLKELRSTLVGADSEFIVEQLDNESTLQQATEAWLLDQQIRLEAALGLVDKYKAEAEEAKAELATLKAGGLDPVGDSVTPERADTTSATDEWHRKIKDAMCRPGVDRMKATAIVNRENPGLRESMLSESRS